MIDLHTFHLTETCLHCARMRSCVEMLKQATLASDSKVSFLASPGEHEEFFPVQFFQVACRFCNGRGQVLTKEGKLLVEEFGRWMNNREFVPPESVVLDEPGPAVDQAEKGGDA